MGNDSELNNKRKRNWIGNVLRRVSFTKRENTIWVFGSWNGKYKDNSKYLFEYVSKKSNMIKAIYFVDNEDDLNHIRSMGNKAVMIGTKEAKEIAKKAGVSFYTNGMDDFGEKIYNYGSIKVALWHGVGCKKIYFNSDDYKDNIIKRIYHTLFSYIDRDYTITTSEMVKRDMIKNFRIKDENSVLILGQPRNDVFFENLKEEKIVLYLPTYRKNIEDDIYIQKAVDYFTSEPFKDVLLKLGYTLIIKLHPLTSGIDIETGSEIVDGKNEDTQELLRKAAVVITDYSSIITDFSLTKRKIILLTPDYKEYLYREGLLDSANVIYDRKNICVEYDEVIDKLYETSNLSEIINEMFNEKTDGGYSEMIYKKMNNILGLRS